MNPTEESLECPKCGGNAVDSIQQVTLVLSRGQFHGDFDLLAVNLDALACCIECEHSEKLKGFLPSL